MLHNLPILVSKFVAVCFNILRTFLDDVFWYNHAFFACEILSLGNLKRGKVDVDQHASSVKSEDYSSLVDVWDSDRVDAEADGFSSGKETTVDSLWTFVSTPDCW